MYLVPFFPRTGSDAVPKVLTVGTQGACSSPTFSDDGSRIAWLEMREGASFCRKFGMAKLTSPDQQMGTRRTGTAS